MLVRVLAATIAGGLVFYLVGFVLYVFVVDPILQHYVTGFPNFMKQPMPSMIYLPLWNLVMALLFAIIFERWAAIRTFVGGLKGGFIVMLLVALIIDFQYLAFTNFWKSEIGVVIDVAAATLIGTLAGGVIGSVLGFMSPKAANT